MAELQHRLVLFKPEMCQSPAQRTGTHAVFTQSAIGTINGILTCKSCRVFQQITEISGDLTNSLRTSFLTVGRERLSGPNQFSLNPASLGAEHLKETWEKKEIDISIMYVILREGASSLSKATLERCLSPNPQHRPECTQHRLELFTMMTVCYMSLICVTGIRPYKLILHLVVQQNITVCN